MKKHNIVNTLKAIHREQTLGLKLTTKVVKDRTKYTRKPKHRNREF